MMSGGTGLLRTSVDWLVCSLRCARWETEEIVLTLVSCGLQPSGLLVEPRITVNVMFSLKSLKKYEFTAPMVFT